MITFSSSKAHNDCKDSMNSLDDSLCINNTLCCDATSLIGNEDKKINRFANHSITFMPFVGCTCLCLLNILLYDSPWILILTILQIVFVFFQLLTNGVDHAAFWHFMFIITGIEATTANVFDFSEVILLSYLRLKLFGPVGLAYVMSIFLMFCALRKRCLIKGLFYKLFLFLFFLFIQGASFSCLGLIMHHHVLDQFIEYNVYLGMVCCNMCLLLHVATPYMRDKLFPTLLTLLAASPVATLLSWSVFQKHTEYSVFDAALQSQIDFVSPCLLLFISFPIKGILYIIIGLLCLACNIIFSGGGDELLIIGLILLVFSYNIFKKKGYWGTKSFIIIFISCLIGFIHNVIISEDIHSIIFEKIREVYSLFTIFSVKSLSDLQAIPHSPYIRISEFLNIFYYELLHPFFLPFGQGPGGYFEDVLNLYNVLYESDYSSDAIFYGIYSYAHGTFPVVLLVNGLFGFIGILYFSIRYLLKIKEFPFFIAAFSWLILSLYFNQQTAIIGMLMLLSYDLIFSDEHTGIKVF